MTVRPSHTSHGQHAAEDNPIPHQEALQPAIAQQEQVNAEVRFKDYRTYTSRELPSLSGKFDALTARNIHVFGRLVSDRGNDGIAFSVVPEGTREDKVIATVYVNNKTSGAARPNINKIIQGEFPAPPELSIQIRGAILNGLGLLGEFKGIPPRATESERDAAVKILTDSNPRVGNLVARYGAVLDVSQGEFRSFLNNLSVKAHHLPGVIRDLSASNTSNNTQHLGAFRLAQVLEATLRQFEHDGLIPSSGVKDSIAKDRYVQDRQANAAPQVNVTQVVNQDQTHPVHDDEPPF